MTTGAPVMLHILRLGLDATIEWDAEVVCPPDGFDAMSASVESCEPDENYFGVIVRWSPQMGIACDARSFEYAASMAEPGDLVLVRGPDGRYDLARIVAVPTPALFRMRGDQIEMVPGKREAE